MTCYLVFLQNRFFFKARRFKNSDEELKVNLKYYLHHVCTGYRKDKSTYRKVLLLEPCGERLIACLIPRVWITLSCMENHLTFL